MSAFTPEQQAEIDKAIAAGMANYAKADSALHVFIREHSQAAFNCALFGGFFVWGSLGLLVGHFGWK